MNLHAAAPASVDLATIKGRQQAAWASGDYAVIGTTLQIVGETLCEAVDLHSNQRVLDVAAGNGNATLAAARRFADVVSTDYVGALLERARERAAPTAFPSRSGKPMPRRFLSRMRASTSCSRPSASCSRQIRRRPQAN
jgi:SAM-dependent methyltransferase